MNGIIGMTNLLSSSLMEPADKERLKIIQTCGTTLLELIDDVLDFSKIESGKIVLEMVPFCLHALIQEIIEMLRERATERHVELSCVSNSALPHLIMGDVTRIRQIVTNLVSNAIKFTEHGSVTVTSEVTQTTDEQLNVLVSVKDTGIGIAPHVIPALFAEFVQADESTTRRFGGSGLGLAICKGLSEAMGGGIAVDSELGRGSTFSFFFPSTHSKSKDAKSKKEPIGFDEADSTMAIKNPLRILVAEDNHTNQIVVVLEETWIRSRDCCKRDSKF